MMENPQGIPRKAVRSSSAKGFSNGVLHFMPESQNLKEIILEIHPLRHARQPRIKQHSCPWGELSLYMPQYLTFSQYFCGETHTAGKMVKENSSLQHFGRAWFCIRAAIFLLLVKEEGK